MLTRISAFVVCVLLLSGPACAQEDPSENNGHQIYATGGLGFISTGYYGIGYQYTIGGRKRFNFVGVEAGYLTDIDPKLSGLSTLLSYTNELNAPVGSYFNIKAGYRFGEDPSPLINASFGAILHLGKRMAVFGDLGLGNVHLISVGIRYKG